MNHSFLNPFIDYYFIYEQIKNYFFNTYSFILFFYFIIAFILFFNNLKYKYNNEFLKTLNYLVLFWMLLEFHKLLIAHVPPRYLVSLIFSIGIFSSIQFYISLKFSKPKFKKNIILVLLIVFCFNLYNLNCLLLNRTYNIKNANEYFKKLQFKNNRPIVGQWANSLAINSKFENKSFTYNSILDSNYLLSSNPKIIIVESNETDTYFLKHKTFLLKNAINKKNIQLSKYKLEIYTLK